MYQKFNVYTPLPAVCYYCVCGRRGGGRDGENCSNKPFLSHSLQVKNRPRDAIAAWQKAKEIGISYKNGYSHNEGSDHFEDAVIPIFKFEEVTMPQAMKDALQQKQFANPTPVQSQTWPVALSGLDVVGVAETGSGKTLAFGLPAFCHARGKDAARGPSCLVVAPTRELIIQIQAELQTFAPATKVSVAYGGTRVFRVEQCHILCSTPGRLIDLANRGWVNLDQVTYLVLDEADRMLDQSFKRDLDKIVDYIPKERQTLMWTATWPREVARVAASFMPGGWLEIGVGYKYLKASEKIRQIVWAVEYHGKFAALKEILQQSVNAQDVKKKCLIFVNSKRMAEELNGRLRGEGITSWFMSGQLEQRDREQRLRDFREAPAPAVLIATDVLQRGLDIKGLDIVVNYDMPKNIEDYTHRIGRTGRAGVTGDAYTLVVERDCADVLPHLVKVLRESKQEVPEELVRTCLRQHTHTHTHTAEVRVLRVPQKVGWRREQLRGLGHAEERACPGSCLRCGAGLFWRRCERRLGRGRPHTGGNRRRRRRAAVVDGELLGRRQ